MRQLPSLRRQKSRNLAVVTLSGQDHYLGPWPESQEEPPAEARERYDALIAQWLAGGRQPLRKAENAPPLVTVGRLIIAFMSHAETHYRSAEGRQTGEFRNYQHSLRLLASMHKETPVAGFTPLKLKALREAMIAAGLARKVINQRVSRIVRMFAWGVSEEMVQETTHRALATVKGLQAGRSAAKETEDVRPVEDGVVDATIPHLQPTLQAVIRVQRLTGMRSEEVLSMRPKDIERAGPIWIYQPDKHKTKYRGKVRLIGLGPKCQELLRPWLDGRAEDAYLFSPRESMQGVRAERMRRRKSKVQPSQKCRKKAEPKRLPGERYGPGALAHAVKKAAAKAGVEPWHPHQLRHAFGKQARKEFGLEGVQAALGHATLSMAEHYAEATLALLIRVAGRLS